MSKIGDIAYLTKYLAQNIGSKNADEFAARAGSEIGAGNLFEGLENYYNTGGGDKVDFTDKQYYANGNTMLMLDTKNQRIAYINTTTGEAEFKSLDQLAPSLKGQDIKFGKDELYKVTEPAGGVKKTEKGNIGVTGNDIIGVKQLAESKGLSMKDAVKEYYLSQNGGDMAKTLEALTGQPYNKDCGQAFLEEFRNKAFDTIAAKLAEKMQPKAETAVDNKDIVVNNYEGFNFDLNTALSAEEKLTLQESTKLDKDLFANNKEYQTKFLNYVKSLAPEQADKIGVENITIGDNGSCDVTSKTVTEGDASKAGKTASGKALVALNPNASTDDIKALAKQYGISDAEVERAITISGKGFKLVAAKGSEDGKYHFYSRYDDEKNGVYGSTSSKVNVSNTKGTNNYVSVVALHKGNNNLGSNGDNAVVVTKTESLNDLINKTTDGIKIKVQTGTTTYNGGQAKEYSTASPLVFDTNHDGKVSAKHGIGVDVNNDGIADGAASGGDKMLAMSDLNGNGKIDGNEVFGDQTVDPFTGKKLNAANGFEALRMVAESAQKNTGVKCIDANGQVDVQALQKALAQKGINLGLISGDNVTKLEGLADIKTVDTKGYTQKEEKGDVQHRQIGSYTSTTGTRFEVDDVWFTLKDEADAIDFSDVNYADLLKFDKNNNKRIDANELDDMIKANTDYSERLKTLRKQGLDGLDLSEKPATDDKNWFNKLVKSFMNNVGM